MRNASIRKKSTCISRIRIYCIFTFLWIFIVCIIFTEFDYESIIAIVQWELKWILYFYNKYNIAVCNVLFSEKVKY